MKIKFKVPGLLPVLRQIVRILSDIYFAVAPSAASVVILIDGKELEGDYPMLIGQKVTATLAIKDKDGRKARIDGAPVWASNPEGIVSVAPSADGLSCEFVGLELPADTTNLTAAITATVDADLRPDSEKLLVASGAITVTTGEAETVALTFSEPV